MNGSFAIVNGNVVIPRFSTNTFETPDGFIVEIELDHKESVYNAYIRHENYGDKLFMFGVPMDQQGYTEFVGIVESNLDDYIPDYKAKYMDYDHVFEGKEKSNV